jgi:hypothetical protein
MKFFPKILITILFAIFFCFVSAGQVVRAQQMTDAQKQTLINQIQQQLIQLQQQLQQMLAQQQQSGSWCYAFNNNLGYANSGTNDIVQLHLALQKEGISYSPDDIGTYSTGTSQGVLQFQTKYGLIPQSGYVGNITREKLNALYACTNSTASNPPPVTGLLVLAKNAFYPNQSVVAPQSKFELADFSLTNNTTEAINLNKIEVDLAINSNFYTPNSYVNNIYVTYGTNKTTIGTNKTTIFNIVNGNNYWTIDYQLPAGQTTDLSVYGDVNSMIPENSIVTASLMVSGKSAVSKKDIFTNSSAVLAGQNITFAKNSLTVGQDTSAPPVQTTAVNKKVIAGKLKFTAASDSYTISELKFIVPNLNPSSTVRPYQPIWDVILSDTATQSPLTAKPILVTYDGREDILDFNVNIPVPLNSSKSVTISYDLSAAVNSDSTNINIAPILVYVKAANSKGVLMDGAAGNYSSITASYGNVSLPAAGVAGNNLYVFKTLPTLTYIPSSSKNVSNGSDINLYTFSVTANPNGDVSIKQLTFIITLNDPNRTNPNLNSFNFLKNGSYYTGSVAIGNIINDNYIGLFGSTGVGIGITNQIIITFNQEEIIPAGKTQTYALWASANNFSSYASGADSVSTHMPSDAIVLNGGSHLGVIKRGVYYGLSQLPTDNSVVSYNLLWSDMSGSFPNPHNDFNGNYTNDWYNGYGILNLPLTPQTLTAK